MESMKDHEEGLSSCFFMNFMVNPSSAADFQYICALGRAKTSPPLVVHGSLGCRMQTVTSLTAMQKRALHWKTHGVKVGFVPTMGYLHAGHISLVTEARKRIGAKGKVVVSIYVNPTQFAPTEDLAKYPRDLARDTRLCREAGVDVLFVPKDEEMYPKGTGTGYSTYVVENQLSQPMEGSSRPTHFRGVTTVVAKLFNLVLPDVAVFGAKDWQQAAVLQRMVRDLNFPLTMVVAPTHRESDGLAMSSRNKYLSPEQRQQATALSRAIRSASQRLESHPRLRASALRKLLKGLIEREPEARVDYIEFFDSETLEPAAVVKRGTHVALTVFVGKTRLIDNAQL